MGILDKFFGPPSKDKFAELVLKELKRQGAPFEAVYDRENFVLKYKAYDIQGEANLGNIYDEYCHAEASEREVRLQAYVRTVFRVEQGVPDEFEDARPDLMPMVRVRSTFDFLRIRQEIEGGPTPDFYVQTLGSHYCVNLAYDFPESMSMLTSQHLEDWGVTPYEALEVARQNLVEREYMFAAIGESLYTSMTGDAYDASRLLLTDLIHKLEVNGDPIAMVPHRDKLFLTGSEDQAGLILMAALAGQALEEPRPMYAIPMRLDGEDWVDWQPAPNHPAAETLRNLEVRSLYGDYQTQQELLNQLYESRDEDVFVASYSAIQKKDSEEITSYCVWGDGVDSLLPKTQQVAFAREGAGTIALVDWSRVRDVVGDLMEDVGMAPPRYRVQDFPTASQLAELEKGARLDE